MWECGLLSCLLSIALNDKSVLIGATLATVVPVFKNPADRGVAACTAGAAAFAGAGAGAAGIAVAVAGSIAGAAEGTAGAAVRTG